MPPQPIHVGNQMRRRVIGKRTKRSALAATTLIEQDDAIKIGIEESAMHGTRLTTRTAVNKNHRRSLRISAFLKINSMSAADIEQVATIRLDGRVKSFAGGLALVYNHAEVTLGAIRSSAA